MPADGPAKLAPVRAARAVDAVRRRLRRVEQTLVPPPTAVLDLMSGAFVARAINTAAILGIPYVLSDGPLTAGVIGAGVGADPDAVRRLLRMLAGREIFTPAGGRPVRVDAVGRPATYRRTRVRAWPRAVLGASAALGQSALLGADRPAERGRTARQAGLRLAGRQPGIRDGVQRRYDERVGHGVRAGARRLRLLRLRHRRRCGWRPRQAACRYLAEDGAVTRNTRRHGPRCRGRTCST
ncbi:MAG: hypothetical protein QOF66_6784 [Mycobacterium sp.]|nr:hypothetical protein [Mycobacterium sp.]